jgi:hypothetical protein
MEIEEIKTKKRKLQNDIYDLLVQFCNETDLQFEKEIIINSFYDKHKAGSYIIDLKIKNPFK